MPGIINRRRFALLLTLGSVAGCASTQHQETVMVIDKPPLKNAIFGCPTIKLLRPDEHKEDQQALLAGIEEQIRGKFLITAQRIRFIHEPPGANIIQAPVFRMAINSIMYKIDEHAELIFENHTLDQPYINIWKTGGAVPEYTAVGYYTTSDKYYDVLIGYFQLKPVQQPA